MINKTHIAPNYFFSPTHPISISVIGAGGNGSFILSRLARIDYALKNINNQGLFIKSFDDDRVEYNNIGRQNFLPNDVGEIKSSRLITKINHSFYHNWKAYPIKVNANDNRLKANIIITCVDNAKFRVDLCKTLKELKHRQIDDNNTVYYWLDLGNAKNTGQYILSTVKEDTSFSGILGDQTIKKTLPNVIDIYPNIIKNDNEETQGKGCSYKENLEEQSLFINDAISVHASDLIYKLLLHKEIKYHGGFLNLLTGSVNPLKC